mgnify:CR=1 FL=1
MKLAVREMLPPNRLICALRYSRSKFSRASRKGKYRGQAQRWIAYRFDGSEDEIDILTPPDGHTAEFSEWRWQRAEELPGLVIPFKRPVYEGVVQAFSAFTR